MNNSQTHNTAQNQNPSQNTQQKAPYNDIINLPRPVIKNHPPMSRDARAAQFAPYAALVGHREIIQDVETKDTFDEPVIIPEYPEEYSEEYPEECPDFPELD